MTAASYQFGSMNDTTLPGGIRVIRLCARAIARACNVWQSTRMSPSTRTVRSGVRCAASRRASASVVRTHNPRRYASAARFSSTLGLPYAVGASVAEGGKRPVMLLTSDSTFLFHIAELETAARQNLPLVCVVRVDHQWGLEVGVYKRTFEQPSPQPGVHWSKDVRF